MAETQDRASLIPPPPPPVDAENSTNDRNNRGNFTRNLSVETDAAIARKMFIGGLFLLPWLWCVNVFHYRKSLVDSSIDKEVTKWVRRSFLGFWLVTIVFFSWVFIFQLNWKEFGWQSLLLQIPPRDLANGWTD